MSEKIYGLDLFSGIGGITLALAEWVKPIAYCECDPYARAVLLSRMAEGVLPKAPIWDDVCTLRAEMLPVLPEIICGGFPCQDISVAGLGKGMEGERSILFFQIARLARECRPRFVFLENVPAILTRGGVEVAETLAGLGYDCRWDIVSAQEVGAPHLRKRWFCLAYLNGRRKLQSKRSIEKQRRRIGNRSIDVADTNCLRVEGSRPKIQTARPNEQTRNNWWAVEPNVVRVANGIPCRVDRIKCLGNAVVPAQVKEAFMRLSGL